MLNKSRPLNLSDTNIAGLGTELEKQVKLAAAQTEQAWKQVGQVPGIKVWRIEQFKVVPWPESDYGSFYSGDSYIVLHTWKKPDSPRLFHDVHFWLGLETSQDEAGTAAYKTVELDDYLLGVPVQYREIQGSESPRFMSYFKYYMVMEGGVSTGFRHVEPESYKPRLLQVKGVKGNLVIREVPLSYKSMNSGDVFLVDNGLTIWQWNGSKSSGQEKQKAVEFSRALASERKSAKVLVIDEGDPEPDFWKSVGGPGTIKSAEEGGQDAKIGIFEKKLFRVSDASGKLVQTLEASGKVVASQLDSNDIFILDAGVEIYAWVGSKASKQEKQKGIQTATKYLVESGRPVTTRISRVIEGGESESFLALLDK